jgi:hypothetical protein
MAGKYPNSSGGCYWKNFEMLHHLPVNLWKMVARGIEIERVARSSRPMPACQCILASWHLVRTKFHSIILSHIALGT